MFRFSVLAFAWAAGALALPAAAEPAAAPPAAVIESGGKTRAISGLDAAALLMQAGRIADAKKVLLALEATKPDDSQALFLLGLIAVQEKDYPTAVRRFRRILVKEPGVARVRLELARAFFLERDWDNAEREFRLARAARLPPGAIANIDSYLYAIRQSRRWTFNLSLAVAPDTDVNAGPAISQIDIFGLPFQLSDQARRHSGVGAAVGLGGAWSAPIGRRWRMAMGAQFDGRVYPDKAYDDLSLSVFAGPELLLRRWDLGVRATGFRRWYGGQDYNQGAGGQITATYYLTGRSGLTGSAGAQAIKFPQLSEQNGTAVSGSFGGFYAPSPQSLAHATLAVTRQSARTSAYAYTAGQFILGYDRDLPGGVSFSLGPSLTVTRYDAPLAAFGRIRSDRQLTMQVAVLNRRIDVAEFTPRLIYTYTRNDSDIPLYAFDRHLVEIGVTRVF
jgi:tetratricopeptide (TPR) repeat protein